MKIFGYYVSRKNADLMEDYQSSFNNACRELEYLRAKVDKYEAPRQLPVTVLDEEMRAAFATADANALWKPIHFMLAFAIEQLTAQVCSQKLSQSPNLMSHAAGALNALREFQYNLHRQHEESKKATEGS